MLVGTAAVREGPGPRRTSSSSRSSTRTWRRPGPACTREQRAGHLDGGGRLVPPPGQTAIRSQTRPARPSRPSRRWSAGTRSVPRGRGGAARGGGVPGRVCRLPDRAGSDALEARSSRTSIAGHVLVSSVGGADGMLARARARRRGAFGRTIRDLAARGHRGSGGGGTAPLVRVRTVEQPIAAHQDPHPGRPCAEDARGPSRTSTTDCAGSPEDMLETMYDAPGVGLAGPQVGLSLRFFVFDDGGPGPRSWPTPCCRGGGRARGGGRLPVDPRPVLSRPARFPGSDGTEPRRRPGRDEWRRGCWPGSSSMRPTIWTARCSSIG